MAIETDLDDFLSWPSSPIIVRLINRELDPSERTAISIALLNSLSESVLREVRGHPLKRHEPDPSLEVIELSTRDRFCTDLTERSEIIDKIEYSSGLDRTISSLALFLIEYRLDKMLTDSGTVSIFALGEITAHLEAPQANINDEIFKKLSETDNPNSLHSRVLSRLWSGWNNREMFLYFDRELQFIDMRPAQPYRIKLSDGLAFRRHWEETVVPRESLNES